MEKGTAEGTLGVGAHDLHTSATLTGNGERTLRSLTNWSSAASPDLGHSEAMPQHSESTTPHGNATAISIARLGSRVLGGKWQDPPSFLLLCVLDMPVRERNLWVLPPPAFSPFST